MGLSESAGSWIGELEVGKSSGGEAEGQAWTAVRHSLLIDEKRRLSPRRWLQLSFALDLESVSLTFPGSTCAEITPSICLE